MNAPSNTFRFFIFSIHSRLIIFPLDDIDKHLQKIRSDPSSKSALGRSLTRILYANQIGPKESRNQICKEIVVTIPVVIYARKDFYLLDAINDRIEIFKAAGLINFWQHRMKKEEKSLNVRKPLKLDHFIGCFLILFFGCCSSLFVFGIELSFKNVCNRFNY